MFLGVSLYPIFAIRASSGDNDRERNQKKTMKSKDGQKKFQDAYYSSRKNYDDMTDSVYNPGDTDDGGEILGAQVAKEKAQH
jgi:hypothetical protein